METTQDPSAKTRLQAIQAPSGDAGMMDTIRGKAGIVVLHCDAPPRTAAAAAAAAAVVSLAVVSLAALVVLVAVVPVSASGSRARPPGA